MTRYLSILKQYWGYDSFRGVQADVIRSIGEGRDTLGLMPTGGGKSVCFQVPALAAEGLCIVVTPLIALMKDQVQQLRQRGIAAAAVYSGIPHEQLVTILDNAVLGAYKFLYLSPERLQSELMRAKLQRMVKVCMLVVDEAHCVSQWGYDFRPSYLQIADVRRLLPSGVPVLALTATAPPRVARDIQLQLGFRAENAFSMSFERKNIVYVVRETENKMREALHILSSVPQGSAIVYTRSRALTYRVAEYLNENGVTAVNYHAGLTNAEKDLRQKAWLGNNVRCVVATNAFGMGIDKPDVRIVIHFGIPDSLEAYYQEAGRAGRDGRMSYAVLLSYSKDVSMMKQRTSTMYPTIDYIREVYEDVSCFLQVGEGEGCGHTFCFDIMAFCRVFKKFGVGVDASLKLLSNAGYIDYHEADEMHSRVLFRMTRDDLYRLGQLGDAEEKVMRCILRRYTGVFAEYCNIEEDYLAKEAGLTAHEVYEALKSLHRARVLDFIPSINTPTITYLMPRVDTRYIELMPQVYADRMADHASRIERMYEYVTFKDKCRSRMLLEYFGQEDVCDCGQCDNCLRLGQKREEKRRNTVGEEL